jgi:hypothetical protein
VWNTSLKFAVSQSFASRDLCFSQYVQEDKAVVLSKQLVAKFVRNAGGMNVGTKASENLYKFMYGQTLPDDDDKQP